MCHIFADCKLLTSLDLSGFNTSNVTDMSGMFSGCSGLSTLDVTKFNTSKVTNMSSMFNGCSELTTLDVTNFDTSNSKDFSSMFNSCSKLTKLDVKNFKTSNSTSYLNMFSKCSLLTELDVSQFNTLKSTDFTQMFYGCSALMKLKMCANLNQEAVTTYWFGKCNSLNEVQLSDFDTYTINKVINELPTRTANNQGCLIVPKIDDSINTSTADSKYWIVSPDSTNIRNMHLGDIVISNLYIGEVEIKKVCLGEIIVYENKQAATGKDTLYNEFTGTLFILKEEALSYDEKELALNINSDIIDVSYNEENLDIGGDK
jgi:surface protein